MKKIISVFLIVCLLSSFLVVASAGQVQQVELLHSERCVPQRFESDANCRDSVSLLASYAELNELEQTILQEIQNMETEIDLRKFNLPRSCSAALCDFIWYCMPLAFHVEGITNWSDATNIVKMQVDFRAFADTQSEYDVCLSAVENAADGILNGIAGNAVLTDVEKALLLHDRLALWNTYDYTGTGDEQYTVYGALGLRKSVCQGYAMAYMYLLDRVGIESYYCASQALNHGWNIVFINDNAYHTDVTWDDRSWDDERGYSGYVEHDNFLRSTEGIIETGHLADDFDSSPTDTMYDNYYWQTSKSAFQMLSNELYYIDHAQQAVKKAGSQQSLCDVESYWSAGGNAYWMGNYSCLSADQTHLLFSKADGVYALNPSDGGTRKILSPPLQTGESVFSFAYESGYLVCDINTTPNNGDRLRQIRQAYSAVSGCAHANAKNTAAVEATCVSVGYTAGVYCEDCKTYISGHAEIAIDPDAHTWNSGVITTQADCNTEGVKTYTCSRNADHKKTENLGMDVNKHTHTRQTEPVAATCTHPGYTAGVYCDDCKSYISGYTALPLDPDAHIWNSGVITTQADCNTKGVKTYTCLHNADHKKTEDLGLEASKHTKTRTVVATEPTTSSVGYTAGVYCDDCKQFISGHEEIPMLPQVAFADGEEAKRIADHVFINSGMTAEQLLSQCNDGAFVMKADGTALTAQEKPATGMILVLSAEVQYVLVMPGDVDGDALVAVADARLALRAAVGLELFDENSAQYMACNVNGGKVEPSDAREILRVSVGLENTKQWME